MRKSMYFCAVVAGVLLEVSLICAQDSSSAARIDESDSKKQCPKDTEVYDLCPSLCPGRTCGYNDSTALCKPPVVGDANCLKPGCRCKDGFYRDDKGNCVPWDKCPKCPPNQQYDPCDNPCPTRYCNFDPRTVRCNIPPQLGDPRCIARCRCQDGYLANDIGICVPIKECPCKGDKNAVRGCGTKCGQLCSDVGRKRPPICNTEDCIFDGCDCREGFFYDSSSGKCVRPEQCKPQCPANEVFSNCANSCQKKTCRELISPSDCVEPKECKPGCLCANGYLRTDNGTCVPIKSCPEPICKENEVVSSCANTGCKRWRCSEDVICIDRFTCEPGCDCAEGYVRDEKNRCIPERECPNSPLNCKENQIYLSCANNGCPIRSCSDVNSTVVCIPKKPSICLPGCVCARGYFQDSNGNCVPPEKCPNPPQTCKRNEVLSTCANSCGKKNCRDITNPPICGSNLQICTTGCVCAEGYLRDDNGDCVPIEKCPATQCPQNEVYSACVNGCQKKTCRDLSFPTECVEPKECRPGCLCADGYLRTDNGTCVPIRSCPDPACKENEILTSCANSGCRRWSCADPGILCIDPIKCEPGCICAEGYVWDDKKRCIPEKQCPNNPPSCKENQILSPCANRNCQVKTCANLTSPVRCIEQGTKECVVGCICAEGYYQDADGNCVPPEKCPTSPQTCKRNEVFTTCVNNCGRKNCRDLTGPLICTAIKACISGCVCAEGYLRDDNGECIPIDKCPVSCNGDENAQYGCSLNCGRLCSDLNSTRPICPKVCPTAGCECKDGFYLDTTINKCVRPDQCIPVSCGGDPNAEPGCGANCGKQCEDVRNIEGDSAQCRDFCTLDGCDCKRGFYFNAETKKCVRAEECPIICQTNEDYNECKNGICVWDNCEDRGKNIKCPPIVIERCEPGCVCRAKYYRRNGVCVPEDQCDIKCQENEVVSSCANGGCRRRKCDDLKEPIVCLYPRICTVGCVCAKGYLLNKEGKCVSEEQCQVTL